MTASKETLAEMLRRFGKKISEEAERFVGDDIAVYSIDISFSASVAEEVPQIMVKRIYNAPECYVPLKEEMS